MKWWKDSLPAGNQFFAMNNNGMLEFLGNEVSDDVSELNIRLRATDSNGSSIEETFPIAFEQEEGDSVVMLSEGVEIVGGLEKGGLVRLLLREFLSMGSP